MDCRLPLSTVADETTAAVEMPEHLGSTNAADGDTTQLCVEGFYLCA